MFFTHRSASARTAKGTRFRPNVERLEDRNLLSTGEFALHIHPNLQITIDGQQVTIPANTGIIGDNFREVHTHDTTGRVHIESEIVHDFSLQAFFDSWDASIRASGMSEASGHQDRCRLIGASVAISVNGQAASSHFGSVVTHDADQIIVSALTPNRRELTFG